MLIRIEKLLKENEDLKTTVEAKNCEIDDLKTSSKVKADVCNNLRRELNEVKTKFNKEKNEMIKNHKIEVKYWGKELGDEKKETVVLKKKLKVVEYCENGTPESKKKRGKETIAPIVSVAIPSEAIICSICAQNIPDYIPEYFCGEELHPACVLCKENTFSSSDPFSNFPTSVQPPSLVSHWLLPHETSPPRNPSSITSLLSHIA